MNLKRAGSFSDPYKVENSRLDADTVEEGLAALLRATPQARVTAIDARGVFVPMPPSLEVPQIRPLTGRSTVLLVTPDDRPAVITAWEEVRTGARAAPRPAGRLRRRGRALPVRPPGTTRRARRCAGGRGRVRPGTGVRRPAGCRRASRCTQDRHCGVHRRGRRDHEHARLATRGDGRESVARLRARRRPRRRGRVVGRHARHPGSTRACDSATRTPTAAASGSSSRTTTGSTTPSSAAC